MSKSPKQSEGKAFLNQTAKAPEKEQADPSKVEGQGPSEGAKVDQVKQPDPIEAPKAEEVKQPKPAVKKSKFDGIPGKFHKFIK